MKRLDESGAGLKAAIKGCMKVRPVAKQPMMACGLVDIGTVVQPSSSTKMMTKEATVRPQVITINNRWNYNRLPIAKKNKHLFHIIKTAYSKFQTGLPI